MSRKGTMQALLGVTIAVIIIFITGQTVYSNIIKPVFFNPEKSVTGNNVLILSQSVENVLQDDNLDVNYETMFFEISNDKSVVFFDFDKENAKVCMNKNSPQFEILKPVDEGCPQDKACICYYESLKDEEDAEPNFCEVFDEEIKFYTEFDTSLEKIGGIGCQKTGHPNNNLDYENVVFVGSTDQLGFWKNLNIFNEWSWGLQEMYVERQKDSNDVNHVLITFDSQTLQFRYKTGNICPAESDSQCIGENFDEAIGLSYCRYDSSLGHCKYEKLKICDEGLIKEKCICEQSNKFLAVESGFCVNGKFQDVEHTSNFCSKYTITNCNDYTKADEDSKYLSCFFDVCGVGPCYNGKGTETTTTTQGSVGGTSTTTTITACKPCPEECTYDLYEEDPYDRISRPDLINSCDCSKIICSNKNSCSDYENENDCVENLCQDRVQDNCIPKYLPLIKTFTRCISCSGITCDDYTAEMKEIDPCNLNCRS